VGGPKEGAGGSQKLFPSRVSRPSLTFAWEWGLPWARCVPQASPVLAEKTCKTTAEGRLSCLGRRRGKRGGDA